VSLDTVESSNPNLKAAHAAHDDAGPGASTRRTQGNPASAAEDLTGKFDKLDIADAESPELFCPFQARFRVSHSSILQVGGKAHFARKSDQPSLYPDFIQ
jgi:hypothetical protein